MYIVIVGAGNIGFYLAMKLAKDKHRVCLVDKNSSVCEKIASTTSLFVVHGDGADPEVLNEIKTETADVMIALTSSDEDNIIICQLAKELFGVGRTIARVNHPQHIKVFTMLGIDVPIDTTTILSRIVEEEASFTDFMNLLSIKKGRLSIVRVDIPENSPVINQVVKDIHLPDDSVLVSVLRGNDVLIPRGDTRLCVGDEVIALTTIEKEKEIVNLLVGNL